MVWLAAHHETDGQFCGKDDNLCNGQWGVGGGCYLVKLNVKAHSMYFLFLSCMLHDVTHCIRSQNSSSFWHKFKRLWQIIVKRQKNSSWI